MYRTGTRREFIRTAATGAAVAGVVRSGIFTPETALAAPKKARVALVRNELAINDRNECDEKQVKLTLEKALFSVTGKANHRDVWASLGVTKDDVVAIKINCNQAGFPLFAHPELVFAVCESLSSVVAPNNIIIYDRSSSELARGGFQENMGTSGIRCFGSDKAAINEKEALTSIVTDMATKIVNLPSLKAFGPSYVGSIFLKNHIGTLPRSDMPKCHGNTPMISEVNARPSIKNKTVIGICDGLRANYQRGVPWFWKGLIVSTDTVAAECMAIDVINEKLKAEKETPNEIPSYVKLADTKHKLGTSDMSAIETMNITI